MVCDVYQDKAIKTAEHTNRRSEDGVVFKKIMPGHKIQTWRLLACIESKNKLTSLLS